MTMVGEHTRKVILQKRTLSQDSSNQMVETWGQDRNIYMSFADNHARQGQSDGQVLVVQDTRGKIRYTPQLDRRVDNQAEANHRIVDGGVVWDILSIVPEGRRKYFILTLERRDNE